MSLMKSAHGENTYSLSVCVDFPDDMAHASFDPEMLDKLFRLYRDWGARRIYWIYTLKHAEAVWRYAPNPEYAGNIRRTRARLGEFLPWAVKTAHRLGLELYAVCKPFDLGINWFTHPFGTALARRECKLKTLSGAVYIAANGLAQRSALRMARHPADLAWKKRPVTAIRLKSADRDAPAPRRNMLTLLVSRDNRRYVPYDRPYRISARRCADGHAVVLDRLHITAPYIALRHVGGAAKPAFSNTLAQLVELRDDRGEPVPFTFGLHSRAAMKHHDGSRDDAGYMFDWAGDAVRENYLQNTVCALDGRPSGIGLAIGKEPFVTCALSPAFPAVRDYWLGHIRECLASGVDGVDIRVGNHNRCLEWEAYGFEPPVVKAYREKYGVDITRAPCDRRKKRDLLGAFYTEYCRAASQTIRQAGAKVQMHIGRDEVYGAMNLTFEWEKWIQEELMDEITLMVDYPSRCWRRVSRLSRAHNIPVLFRKYMRGIVNRPHWRRMLRDYLASSQKLGQQGFILYESAFVTQARPDGEIQMLYPDIPAIFEKAIK